MDLAPIEAAIQKGDCNTVRALLAEAPDLASARTKQGVSLVSLACYHRQPAIAAILREYGSLIDIFDACAVGDEERVRTLAEAFPESIHAYSPDGFYPLGLAAFFGHRKIVEYLIDAGADVNQVADNAFKVAPLHAAVSNGDIEIVKILLEHNADATAKQQNDFTPLDAATQSVRQDLVDLLQRYV
jgi:ankyrin repeat protein